MSTRKNEGTKGSAHNDAATGQLDELGDIKRLLVLLLLKCGATQLEIAKALGLNQATVSRNYAIGNVKALVVTMATRSDKE